jgi:hypothetical protein
MSVLDPPLAKADGYQPNSVYLLGLDPNDPIGLFDGLDIGTGGFEGKAFGLALPLEGRTHGLLVRRAVWSR